MVYHGLRNMRIPISIPICLLLLAGASSGANDKAVGKELIEKARKLSDIRAEGAPAFRIEGSFRIIPKKGGKEIGGTYTEIWISRSKWRREVQTSSFHRVEVGTGDKKWLADSGSDRPDAALYAPMTLVFSKQIPEVHQLSERELGTTKAICVESRAGEWSKGIDCVDPNSGVFLVQETLLSPPNNLPSVHHSCAYRNYESFAEHLFPRSIRCTNDPGDDVELTIVKLATETSPEESLFSQPAGAVETRGCQGRITAPHALYSPDPAYPGHHHETPTVVLWTVVSEDGKPRDLRVARSAGKDFDQAALDAVGKWKFQPAMCDGVPIPVQINVEITFRIVF
jgi:TonB family protein